MPLIKPLVQRRKTAPVWPNRTGCHLVGVEGPTCEKDGSALDAMFIPALGGSYERAIAKGWRDIRSVRVGELIPPRGSPLFIARNFQTDSRDFRRIYRDATIARNENASLRRDGLSVRRCIFNGLFNGGGISNGGTVSYSAASLARMRGLPNLIWSPVLRNPMTFNLGYKAPSRPY
jgi:hypothetical protein